MNVTARSRADSEFHFAMNVGMTPCRAAISFAAVLNSAALSAAAMPCPLQWQPHKRRARSRYGNPPAEFRMPSVLDHVEHQLGVLRCAQHAVTEHSRAERRQILEALFAQGLRRFAEQPELVLGCEPAPCSRAMPRDSRHAAHTCRGEMAQRVALASSSMSIRKNAVPGSQGMSRNVSTVDARLRVRDSRCAIPCTSRCRTARRRCPNRRSRRKSRDPMTATDANFSRLTYLPRRTPSISVAPSFTRRMSRVVRASQHFFDVAHSAIQTDFTFVYCSSA